MQPQPIRQQQPAHKPSRTPEEALRDVVAEVAEDARQQPEAYLKETRVPAGGE